LGPFGWIAAPASMDALLPFRARFGLGPFGWIAAPASMDALLPFRTRFGLGPFGWIAAPASMDAFDCALVTGMMTFRFFYLYIRF
jgi:hypothetical protein